VAIEIPDVVIDRLPVYARALESLQAEGREVVNSQELGVASLVYEYQPKVLAKEKDRIENPFGFVVTAYRSDPEIATTPPPSATKQ
jgi:hypothetical protein